MIIASVARAFFLSIETIIQRGCDRPIKSLDQVALALFPLSLDSGEYGRASYACKAGRGKTGGASRVLINQFNRLAQARR